MSTSMKSGRNNGLKTPPVPTGGEYVTDPTEPLSGFKTSTRKQWTAVNRIRSRHVRTAKHLHRWNIIDIPNFPLCNISMQDTDHVVNSCLVAKLDGGYLSVHESNHNFKKLLEDKQVKA